MEHLILDEIINVRYNFYRYNTQFIRLWGNYMEKYTAEQYFEMIPQRGVRQCFIDAPGFNATWDYKISPEGRHYFPLCAEGNFPEYVKLYEYLPKTNEVRRCFDLEDSIIVYPRTIRPSKIHTSINFMPDGKLIMTTHTTASAPTHPTWMPEAYFDHMWEGFHGSNILIYDPETGKVEDLGIPVPRDTIYGAVYIHETRSLYFSTYMRGHAYRFDLDDRSVTDYGQCTEFGAYYMFRATDGNIYFSTRSGELWRFNIKTKQPEYTGIEIPRSDSPESRSRNVFAYADNGPDGRMYFCTHTGRYFFAYDWKTNTLENLGLTVPEGMIEDYPNASVFGMAFDKDGILWYSLSTVGSHICRWDIMKPGTKPEDLGLAGTPKRCHTVAENIFIRDDILFFSDTNHADDAPGILQIPLETLRNDAGQPRERCMDPLLYYYMKEEYRNLYPGDPADFQVYIDSAEYNRKDAESARFNRATVGDKRKFVAKHWKTVGIPGSKVCSVTYQPDGTVRAIIEKDGGTAVTVKDGEVLKVEAGAGLPEPENLDFLKKYALPYYPGRQYLAQASAYCKLADNSMLVGTRDGMLALIKNEHVFRLGSVCNDGPVRAIAASPDGRHAYGAAGDPDSLGMIFSYDIDEGVSMLGHIYFEDGDSCERTSVSCEPCCVAVSCDGTRFAVGVRDQLGCVYEFEI